MNPVRLGKTYGIEIIIALKTHKNPAKIVMFLGINLASKKLNEQITKRKIKTILKSFIIYWI